MTREIIVIIIVVLIVGAFYFSSQNGNGQVLDNNSLDNIQTTSGDLKREVPLEANSGRTFEIKYIVKPSPSFKMAAVEDTVSGGCKFPGGETVYRMIVFNSGERVVKVEAPSSGSCTFSGEYGYRDDETQNPEELKILADQTVMIK